MAPKLSPVQALVITRAPLVNKDGTASWDFMKILQTWSNQLSNSLTAIGQFVGVISPNATIADRVGNVGATLHNIGANGEINTDNLTDGTGSPLAGGRVAFDALIGSGPTASKSLIYDGSTWNPDNVAYSTVTGAPVPPENTPAVPGEWIRSYDAASGEFAQSQPSFADIAGQISSGQLPSTGLTQTVTLAALTVGGTQGSIEFTNGIATAIVDPT